MNWKASLVALCVFGAGASVLAQPAQRQGMGNLPPEAQKAMKAWMDFQQKHPNYRALSRTFGGLGRLMDDAKLKLNKAQAKSVLTIIGPWRSKPVMSDAQAKAVNDQLTKVLNAAQVAKLKEGRGGPGGPGGPGGRPGEGGQGGFGGGRPPQGGTPQGGPPQGGGGQRGGQGGQGGFRMNGQMPTPKEYNPLNPASQPIPQMRERAQKRFDETLAKIKKAAG